MLQGWSRVFSKWLCYTLLVFMCGLKMSKVECKQDIWNVLVLMIEFHILLICLSALWYEICINYLVFRNWKDLINLKVLVIDHNIPKWCKLNFFLQVLKSTFSSSFGISCWFWAVWIRLSRGKPYVTYLKWPYSSLIDKLFIIDTWLWCRLLNV
jgi:hypothetical protein